MLLMRGRLRRGWRFGNRLRFGRRFLRARLLLRRAWRRGRGNWRLCWGWRGWWRRRRCCRRRRLWRFWWCGRRRRRWRRGRLNRLRLGLRRVNRPLMRHRRVAGGSYFSSMLCRLRLGGANKVHIHAFIRRSIQRLHGQRHNRRNNNRRVNNKRNNRASAQVAVQFTLPSPGLLSGLLGQQRNLGEPALHDIRHHL